MADDINFSVNYSELDKALGSAQKGFKQLSGSVEAFDKDVNNAFGDAEKATESLIRAQRKLEAQIKGSKTDEEARKLKTELAGVERELDKISKKQAVAFGATNKGLESTSRSASSLKGAIGAAFAVTAVIEFGQQVKQIADEVKGVEKQIRAFGKTSGEQTEQATVQALTLAKAYGEDVTDIIETANVIADRFGITFVDALGKIDDAYSKGANVRKQYNEQVKEYADFFLQAGLNIDQTNAFLTTFEKRGVFSDKATDAIKEFILSVRELTPATKKALNDVGVNTAEWQKQILSGERTYFEYAQFVTQRMKAFGKDSQQYGAVLADVWRGAGEDAGIFIDVLQDLDTNFENYESTLTDQEKANRRLLQNWTELTVQATKSGSSIDKAYTAVLNIAADAIEYFQDLVDESEPLIAVFDKVGEEVGDLWSEIEVLLKSMGFLGDEAGDAEGVINTFANSVEFATTPIRLLITVLTDLIAAFNGVIADSPELEDNVGSVADKFEAFQTTLAKTPAFLRGLYEAAKETFVQLKDVAADTLGGVGTLLVGVLTFNKAKVAQGLAQSKTAIEDYGAKIGDAFRVGYEKAARGVVEVTAGPTTEGRQAGTGTERPRPTATISPKLPAEDRKALAARALERRRLEIDAMAEGLEKELAQMEFAHQQRIKKLRDNNIDTSNVEADFQAKRLAKIKAYNDAQLRASRQAENKEYADKLERFDAEQKLAKSEFDLSKRTQTEITRFELSQQLERLQFLRNNATQKEAVELQYYDNLIAGIKQKLAGLDSQVREEGFAGFLKRTFGLDDEGLRSLEDAAGQAIGYLQELTAAQVDQANRQLAAIDEQIAAQRELVDAERRAAEAGKASNLKAEEEKLAGLKAARQEAAKDAEAAKKQQLLIDSALQASSLVTATAKIWASNPALAIPTIALMWGSFLGAKIRAFSETGVAQYAKGEVNLKGGVRGKDSIPAMLMPGETVFTTQQTADNLQLFEGIYENDRYKVLGGAMKLMSDFGLHPLSAFEKGGIAAESFSDAGIRSDLKRMIEALMQGESVIPTEGGYIVKRGNIKQTIKHG